MQVGALGPASTVTAGHAAGASAVCYAFDLAAFDHADAVLALSVDALTETVMTAYRALGVHANAMPALKARSDGSSVPCRRAPGARARPGPS
jgi:3-oxoacyl-[acyl-carrier-protein] synthase II